MASRWTDVFGLIVDLCRSLQECLQAFGSHQGRRSGKSQVSVEDFVGNLDVSLLTHFLAYQLFSEYAFEQARVDGFQRFRIEWRWQRLR